MDDRTINAVAPARRATANEGLKMSHAQTQWNRMKNLVEKTILLGTLIAGSAAAWAGTVIIEEDLNAVERSRGATACISP